jgi:hypothetical protein
MFGLIDFTMPQSRYSSILTNLVSHKIQLLIDKEGWHSCNIQVGHAIQNHIGNSLSGNLADTTC